MNKLLLSGGMILTSDDDRPVIEEGYVLIEDNQITEVGSGEPKVTNAGERLDCRDMLITPGFINAHTHLCMILGRTLGSDRSLLHWLSESQVPLMQRFEAEDYAISMELGAIENLKAGNTTVCEVFFSPHYEQEVDRIATRALDASGVRTVFFRCSNDESFFEGFVETRKEIVDRSERLIADWSRNARTCVGVGPLVPWGSSPESFREAVELSGEHGVGIHLHTSETPEYNDLVRDRTGQSNVEMLADVGALGEKVMLNHCVHLSDHDIGLIAETGSHMIHDPTSNMILASGTAPVPKLLEHGVNVGLACDGPACNNGQDMIETMKDAALLHKVVTREPEVLVANDVFKMATRGGAQAIGLADRLGAIKEGFLADLVLLDLRAPHLTPHHDPLVALVYSARGSDVDTVIVDGQIVVRHREVTTLDEEEVRVRASERASRARNEAGI